MAVSCVAESKPIVDIIFYFVLKLGVVTLASVSANHTSMDGSQVEDITFTMKPTVDVMGCHLAVSNDFLISFFLYFALSFTLSPQKQMILKLNCVLFCVLLS